METTTAVKRRLALLLVSCCLNFGVTAAATVNSAQCKTLRSQIHFLFDVSTPGKELLQQTIPLAGSALRSFGKALDASKLEAAVSTFSDRNEPAPGKHVKVQGEEFFFDEDDNIFQMHSSMSSDMPRVLDIIAKLPTVSSVQFQSGGDAKNGQTFALFYGAAFSPINWYSVQDTEPTFRVVVMVTNSPYHEAGDAAGYWSGLGWKKHFDFHWKHPYPFNKSKRDITRKDVSCYTFAYQGKVDSRTCDYPSLDDIVKPLRDNLVKVVFVVPKEHMNGYSKFGRGDPNFMTVEHTEENIKNLGDLVQEHFLPQCEPPVPAPTLSPAPAPAPPPPQPVFPTLRPLPPQPAPQPPKPHPHNNTGPVPCVISPGAKKDTEGGQVDISVAVAVGDSNGPTGGNACAQALAG